jgi:hypothetical protein
MSLEDKLAKVRAQMAERIPDVFLEVIHRSTDDLANSGILDGTIKVGDTLPAFNLENASGTTISSGDLLGKGPIVLTVFRGHW